MTWAGWANQLLGALGAPATPARLRFLAAWQKCEGGTAAFNPLNTTMPLLGASDYNGAHVKNYRDELQGLAATLLTLRLDYYHGLVQALRAPNLTAVQIAQKGALGLDTWGTGSKHVLAALGH